MPLPLLEAAVVSGGGGAGALRAPDLFKFLPADLLFPHFWQSGLGYWPENVQQIQSSTATSVSVPVMGTD